MFDAFVHHNHVVPVVRYTEGRHLHIKIRFCLKGYLRLWAQRSNLCGNGWTWSSPCNSSGMFLVFHHLPSLWVLLDNIRSRFQSSSLQARFGQFTSRYNDLVSRFRSKPRWTGRSWRDHPSYSGRGSHLCRVLSELCATSLELVSRSSSSWFRSGSSPVFVPWYVCLASPIDLSAWPCQLHHRRWWWSVPQVVGIPLDPSALPLSRLTSDRSAILRLLVVLTRCWLALWHPSLRPSSHQSQFDCGSSMVLPSPSSSCL